MWIIAGYVTVDEGKRDAFVEAHRDLITRARQAPGCLDVAITADPVDPRRIYNYERWTPGRPSRRGALAPTRRTPAPPCMTSRSPRSRWQAPVHRSESR